MLSSFHVAKKKIQQHHRQMKSSRDSIVTLRLCYMSVYQRHYVSGRLLKGCFVLSDGPLCKRKLLRTVVLLLFLLIRYLP